MSAVATDFAHWLPSARKLWLNLHLWLGLTAGFALALIGLSGAFLVFLNPMMTTEFGRHLFEVDGPPPRHAAVNEWIAGAKRAYGDIGTVDFVMGPGFGVGAGNAANLDVVVPDGKRLTVTIDPNTGRALGTFVWDDSYTTLILRFHVRLSSALSWGGDVIAWLGVAMMVSMATGLYLWWPRNRNWRVAFTIKRGTRGRRRLLDLHNIFAVYLYLPLLILAGTGVYINKPNWIDPAISLVSVPRTPDSEALARAAKPGACSARTTPGEAADLAQARFPTSTFVLIVIPGQPQQPYRVQLAPPNNLDDKGQTQVFVDRECPVILTAIDGEIRVASEVIKAVVFPLHRDLMLGPFGKAIVFVSGLLLPLSFVTGVLLWLGKRKNRRSAKGDA
jgi:uncharacterized iron-regulated membrane protein